MKRLGIVTAGVCILVASFGSRFTLTAAPAPKGPSVGDVYAVNAGLGTSVTLCDQAACSPAARTLVATLLLPAGSYSIAAKLVINGFNSTGAAESFCYLNAGATVIDHIAAGTSLEVPYVPAALQAAATFSGPTTITITCANNNGLTAGQNWQLMATKVGTVSLQ
jgi:hypothetical protein